MLLLLIWLKSIVLPIYSNNTKWENYANQKFNENMYGQMHQNTNERERIGKMIKELNERLSKSEPAV